MENTGHENVRNIVLERKYPFFTENVEKMQLNLIIYAFKVRGGRWGVILHSVRGGR